jgi:cytochrome c oxidase assembly factor CtaG
VLHGFEHLWFLVTGVVLWHAAVATPLRTGRRIGQGLLALVASSVAIGALGALLLFSGRPWYPDYAAHAISTEVALTDQQIAGVMMWLATTPLLLAAAVALGARLLVDAERRAPALVPVGERAS